MACYLCKYKISFYTEYLDNQERLLCSECFHELNDIIFPHDCYIYYSINRLQIRNNEQELMFFLDIFSYKELKRSLKYKIKRKKFDATYLYDFRIGT